MSTNQQPGPDFAYQAPAEKPAAPQASAKTKPPRWAGAVGAGLAGLILGGIVMSGGPSDEELKAALVRADQVEAAMAEAADENEADVDALTEEVAEAKRAMAEAEARAEGAEAAALKSAEAKLAKRVADAEAKLAARAKEVGTKEASVLAREKAVGTAEAVAAANTFDGDGVYLVGDDIQPGTYKSEGGSTCYWARQDSNGGIIDNELVSGPTIVTVRASDFSLKVSGCAPFTRR